MSSATYDMTSPMDGPCLFALSTCCRTLSIPGRAGRAAVDEPAIKQSSRTSGRLESSMAVAGMDKEQASQLGANLEAQRYERMEQFN